MDIAENMESESYIQLTKKHDQKQKHLVEIIDRQQARINLQSNKVIELEDQEEEIQGYLQELEASLHMSEDNGEIIEKTIAEVQASRMKGEFKRKSTAAVANPKSPTGVGGAGSFRAAGAAAAMLNRTTRARKTTMADAKVSEQLYRAVMSLAIILPTPF